MTREKVPGDEETAVESSHEPQRAQPQRKTFSVVFSVPRSADPNILADIVFRAGLKDPLIGTGTPGLMAVEFEAEDEGYLALGFAMMLLTELPEGSGLAHIEVLRQR